MSMNFKKNAFLFCMFLYALLNIHSLHATNYEGKYKLFSHLDFESGTTDLLGNMETTDNGTELVYDNVRDSRVMRFNAATKSNLKLDTYPLNDTMTIALWFKREDANPSENWRMIFAFYAEDGSNLYLTPKTNWSEDGYLVFDNKNYSSYASIRLKEIKNNIWTHLAVTFSGNHCKVYLNGEYVGGATTIGTPVDMHTTKHYLGNYPEKDFRMSGCIDDFRIYHTALSENQIDAIFKELPIPDPVDAKAPFVKIGTQGDIFDEMGNVQIASKNIGLITGEYSRHLMQFGDGSYLTTVDDPIGQEKYSLAMLYQKDNFTAVDDGRQLFRFACANGDYIALYLRYIDAKAKLEVEKKENGVITQTGVTTNALKEGELNSIIFLQTYSTSNNGAYRLYINGIRGQQVTGFFSRKFAFNQWTIGDLNGNSANGLFSEICFYKRELSVADMAEYTNSQLNNIVLNVNLSEIHQIMRNFGSSDGFNAQFVGRDFTEDQKEQIAELLFSNEVDADGNPKGIGLTAWRFNIGSGTSEQGEASRITQQRHRTECFMNPDMTTYDWTKQVGQRYFLKKASDYGVPDIIGWQNSPPVYYTKRGLGFREYGDPKETTLKAEHFTDFANFLANVISHFKEEGIHIKYLSPLNEPQWDWTAESLGGPANAEGSPWTNKNISDVVKSINSVFEQRKIDTKLFISEAGAVNCLLETSTGHARKQLSTLWGSTSDLSVNGLHSMSNVVSAHSYWDDVNNKNIIDTRKQLYNEIQVVDPKLEYWQTEYSFLGDGFRYGHPTGDLTPMQSGISLARIMHADIVFGGATGWQWWTTFEDETYLSAVDRFALIRYAFNKDRTETLFRTTKLLYTLGQYSFFVRPGMKRIGVERSDNMDEYKSVTNQMFSAYMDPETRKVVIVAINASQANSSLVLPEIDCGDNYKITKYTPYITSDAENDNMRCLEEIGSNNMFMLPGTSIVTFVGEPTNVTSVQQVYAKPKMSLYPNPAKSWFTVKCNTVIKNIAMYDVTGKAVLHKACDKTEEIINVDRLTEGVYIVVGMTDDGVISSRVIVH